MYIRQKELERCVLISLRRWPHHYHRDPIILSHRDHLAGILASRTSCPHPNQDTNTYMIVEANQPRSNSLKKLREKLKQQRDHLDSLEEHIMELEKGSKGEH
jgi:hypothetical protein